MITDLHSSNENHDPDITPSLRPNSFIFSLALIGLLFEELKDFTDSLPDTLPPPASSVLHEAPLTSLQWLTADTSESLRWPPLIWFPPAATS
eukprot:1192366-Prorocentrum_minimum.AAC.1